MYTSLLVLTGVLTIAAVVALRLRNEAPLPPGPKGRFPLLGMTFDMPAGRPWLTLTKWVREFGPLVHYRIGLQHFIVVGSGAVARDLLVRRASKFSSRPPSKVAELIGGDRRSVLMPYGERWRHTRRVFTNVLTEKKCNSYINLMEAEAIWSLTAIRDKPQDWGEELERYTLSIVRSITYGQRVRTHDDPFIKGVSKMSDQFSVAMTPGRYMLESMPALRFLPKVMQPGRSELEHVREYELGFPLDNYHTALDWAAKHPDKPCIAHDVQREMCADGLEDEQQAASTCMEILAVGSHTTALSLTWLIMACLLNPECVQKAHAELDRVVGQDRFPTWSDEPNLPYIRAMIKEQQRWRTIAPLSTVATAPAYAFRRDADLVAGFQHSASEEDGYDGYRIPKGSIIRINTWAMHTDPNRYPEPDKYTPDRFLGHSLSASAYANSSDVTARDHFSFGTGKRICVGIHLAERSLFIAAANLLHAFDIVRATDEAGNAIPINPDAVEPSLVPSALPFPAVFKLRNEKIAELLQKESDRPFFGADEGRDTLGVQSR